MRKDLWLALLVVALVLAIVAPASAITRGGTLDGEDHPYVGLMVASVEGEDEGLVPAWRCSGALIAPDVYVTAGHCTSGADRVDIWFQTDLHADDHLFGYPFGGASSVSGTPHTHPDYLDEAFFLYDLGIVVLDEEWALDRYAELPELGALDDLGNGRVDAAITAVGYGLQQVKPEVRDDLTRYQAGLFVVDDTGVAGLKPYEEVFEGSGSFVVSGDAKHGGTCSGDSGGPLLDGDTILGVTSFGLNANCAGVGGGYRIDQTDDVDFIEGFLE